MGSTQATALNEIQDWSRERELSKEHNITAWDQFEKTKNADYYNGTRFTHISRRLYPNYVRGWIYGYSYDPNCNYPVEEDL